VRKDNCRTFLEDFLRCEIGFKKFFRNENPHPGVHYLRNLIFYSSVHIEVGSAVLPTVGC
jgi:hypothetical protein